MISARTSRPSPLVSSSTRIASRKLPNAAPADVSETASEDISSGAGWHAACSRAAPQTSWASPHSSLIRMVNSRSRSPRTTPRTSTTRSPLNAMYSLSFLSKLSTAGAASRGVLRIPPSNGSGRSCIGRIRRTPLPSSTSSTVARRAAAPPASTRGRRLPKCSCWCRPRPPCAPSSRQPPSSWGSRE